MLLNPKEHQKLRGKIRILLQSTKLTKKNGYFWIGANSSNKELFELLKESGIMEFHLTNSGKGFYLHQIICFLKRRKGGWFYLNQGLGVQKGLLEVHHIDHNIENNSPENLEYVTPELNKLAYEFTKKYNLSKQPEEVIKLVKRKFKGQFVDMMSQNISKFISVILRSIKNTKPESGFTMIDGIIYKLTTKTGITFNPFSSLSAKQMLSNMRKFGYCRSTTTY